MIWNVPPNSLHNSTTSNAISALQTDNVQASSEQMRIPLKGKTINTLLKNSKVSSNKHKSDLLANNQANPMKVLSHRTIKARSIHRSTVVTASEDELTFFPRTFPDLRRKSVKSGTTGLQTRRSHGRKARQHRHQMAETDELQVLMR